MKSFRVFRTLVLVTLFLAALGQRSGLADVKILVPASMKARLADLEDHLPNLDLVFAERRDMLKLVVDCDAIVPVSYSGQAAGEPRR